MSKIRVHELAKELNISSKTVLTKLKEYGIVATSHMSTIDEESVSKLKDFYQKNDDKQAVSPQNYADKNQEQIKNEIAETKEKHIDKEEHNFDDDKSVSQNQNRQKKNGFDGQQQKSQAVADGSKNSSNENVRTGQKPFNAKGQQSNNKYQNNNKQQNNGKNQNGTSAQNGGKQPQSVKNQSSNNGGKNINKNNKNNYNNVKNDNKQVKKQEQPKPVQPQKAPEQVENELKMKEIPASLTVKELAETLEKSSSEIVKLLMKKGKMLTLNNTLTFEEASEIAEEFNIILELEEEKDILEETFKEEPDNDEDLIERSPVVVVMGHVDHGKTSLLDSIRHSRVTAGEAGGITQHIGAYTVEIDKNPITFLDTPGHEAFTAMRMRGAQVTDIAILVVAADDGVMPQTVEAINHAKAAGVEIIVAINKIDKVGANPDRVKQELVEYGILTEDWGGDTICVPVSAINKEGIDTLLEMIILVAEMKELKANPKKKARGTIIEAQLDKGRGPVATVLVQDGTLNIGDPIVAGCAYGKIRAMMDDKGKRVKKAGPSTPVEILGLSEVPSAGDSFYVAENEKQARQVAETIIAKNRTEMIKETPQKVSLDDLFTQIQSGNVKELKIVVKADVQGSVEAIKQSLEKLSNDEVRVSIIHGGVGTITESDVMLASASNAIIIGFNVRPEPAAKTFADTEKVDVRLYKVIYNAIEDIMSAMKGMLDPVYEEKVIGHAEVRQLFKASGVGTIAGSYVTDGKFQRGCKIRVIRDGEILHDGELESLKRFKDDVKEVSSNYECGLVIKKFNDLKEGDTVEAYIMVEVPR